MQVGELFATFSLDTSGFVQAVAEIEGELARMGAGLSAVGAGLGRTLTAPLLGMAREAAGAGLAFSSQMSTVAAISGESGEALAALRQAAIDAGSQTAFTATQAGQALQYMAMAGWDSADMLKGLRPVMDLAAASGEDLASTSDILTDAMTALGYAASENWKEAADGEAAISNAQHFADVLAAAATSSNTNVSMLGQSFKYAAPLAGALGYSVEDVALALGLMANSGVKASQAGTTLRSLFKRLANPPKAAAKAMEDYGISLTDAQGKMKDLRVVLLQMREAARGMSETERAGFAADIAGTTGMSGFLALLGAAEEDYGRLTLAVDQCQEATSRMAGVQLDNARGAITILRSAVEGLQISLFDLFEGTLKTAAGTLTDVVNAFRGAGPQVQKMTLSFLALAASVGPALQGLGMLLPLLPALVSPMGAVVSGLALFAAAVLDAATAGAELEGIGQAARSGMGMVERGIAALTEQAPLLGQAAEQMVQDMEKTASRIPRLAQALGELARKGLPEAVSALGTVFSGLIAQIGEHMDEVLSLGMDLALGLAQGILKTLPELAAALTRAGTELVSSLFRPEEIESRVSALLESVQEMAARLDLSGLVQAWGGAIADMASDLAQLAGTALSSLKLEDGALENWAEQLRGGIRTALTALERPELDLSGARDLGNRLGTAVREGLEGLGQVFETLLDGVSLTDWAGRLGVGIREAAQGAVSFLSGLLSGLVPDFSALSASLASALAEGASALSSFLSGLFDEGTLAGMAKRLASLLEEALRGLGAVLTRALAGEDGDWKSVGSRIMNGLLQGLSGLSEAFLAFFTGIDWLSLGAEILSALTEAFSGAGEALLSFLSGEQAAALGQEMGEAVLSGLGSLFEALPSALAACLKSALEAGKALPWTELGTAMAGGLSALLDAANGLGGVFSEALEAVKGLPWDGIGAGILGGIGQVLDAGGQFLSSCFSAGLAAVSALDWTGLGRTVLDGIGACLDAGGAFLSSLLGAGLEAASALDFGKIGTAVLEGLQGCLDAGGAFLSGLFKAGLSAVLGLNWPALGQGILSGLGAVLEGGGAFLSAAFSAGLEAVLALDWEKIGTGISAGVTGLLDTGGAFLSGLFETGRTAALDLDWSGLGEKIAGGVHAFVDTGGLFLSSAFETARSAIASMDWAGLGAGIAGHLQSALQILGDVLDLAGSLAGKGISGLRGLFGLDEDSAGREQGKAAGLALARGLSEAGVPETAGDIAASVAQAVSSVLTPESAQSMGSQYTLALGAGLAAGMGTLAQEVTEGLDSVQKAFSALDADQARVRMEAFLGQIASGLAKHTPALKEGAEKTAQALLEPFGALGQAIGDGAEALSLVLLGTVQTMAEQLPALVQSLCSALTDLLSGFSQETGTVMEALCQSTLDAAQALSQALLQGASGFAASMLGTVQALCTGILSAVRPMPPALQALAVAAFSGMQAAFRAGAALLQSITSAMASQIRRTLETQLSPAAGRSLAASFMDGLRSGISQMASGVASAAAAAAQGAVSAMRRTLRIHSPSRVTEEIGEQMALGTALGLSGGILETAALQESRKTAHLLAQGLEEVRPVRAYPGTAEPAREESAGNGASMRTLARELVRELAASGVFGGDIVMDGETVGRRVTPAVSREISDSMRRTLEGRRLGGIVT